MHSQLTHGSKYLELNISENTTYQNIRDAEKFINLKIYIRK